uniref:Uncharacterized protein n=1 Tax=Romanomermis culicivorax TaxID=13658 RepID=A0A915LDI2_ROMCU
MSLQAEKTWQLFKQINNAGITKDTLIDHFNMETYDEVMNVNLKAMVSLTMKCLPHLKVNRGSIVNVSSIASTRPKKTLCEGNRRQC